MSPEGVSSAPWPSRGLLCIPAQIVRTGPLAGHLDTGILGLSRAALERAPGLKQGLTWTLREGLQNHVIQAPAPSHTCTRVYTDMYTYTPHPVIPVHTCTLTPTHILSDARTYLHMPTHTTTHPHLVMHTHPGLEQGGLCGAHSCSLLPHELADRQGTRASWSRQAQHPLWTFGDVS